jgi:hypothetical protein
MVMVVMMIVAITIIHYNLSLIDYSLGILLSSLFQMNINNIRYFLKDNVIQGIILMIASLVVVNVVLMIQMMFVLFFIYDLT